MFKPVGSLIREIPTRTKIAPALVALRVREAAKDALKAVCRDLPPEIVESVKPTTFKGGTLTLVVNSPLVSSELQMRSEGLIEAINEVLGAKAVRALRFRLK